MTKTEQLRVTTWRSKVLQHAAVTGNVARTCRRFGISRKSFYKSRRRFGDHGDAGLCDRPRTPRRVPRAAADDVISKIVDLRQHYHFGAGRIAAYLKRFHQVAVARSTVHRILTRRGMPRLPANQKHRAHGKRWQRYEKPQPGHRLQVDVKFLERIPGTRRRFYQFTAIDDCTRMRVLKVFDACSQRTAIQFMDDVLRRLPFRVHVVQTDNGAEFQSQFHWHLEQQDIRHVYIRPRTPHLNGKVERSHRVDDQEFYQLLDQDGISDDITLFNEKLREWEDYYNCHRPHGASDGQTPYERLLAKRERRCHQGLETLHSRRCVRRRREHRYTYAPSSLAISSSAVRSRGTRCVRTGRKCDREWLSARRWKWGERPRRNPRAADTAMRALLVCVAVCGATIVPTMPAWAQTVSFSQTTNYPTGPGPRSVAIADFTGDGIPDLVTANLKGANVSLLAGTGGGAFSAPVNFAVGSMPAFVATEDFNGDGAADLAVANLSGGSVSIVLGNGAGGVQSVASLSSPNGPTSIAIADFNHDLHLDLAVGGVNTGNVYIFLGNGAGAFTPHGFVQSGGTGSHAVATGEFNGDAHPDLAVADFFVAGAATGVSILLGSATGTFVLHQTVDVAPKPQHIAIGDYNGDGPADLAVAYAGPTKSAGAVAVLLGTGTGAFGSPTSFTAGNLPIFVVSRDLNGDTILDLAVANLASGNTVSVLVGAGNGSFDPPLQCAVGNRSGSVAVADLNADGLPDLAVTNENDNTVSVLLNSGAGGQPQGVLSVARSGTGSGTVTSNPLGIACGVDCTESYQLGTSVTLTATPSSTSFFAGWTGGGCSGTAPCSVTVSDDLTVSAIFTATRFPFTDDPLTTGTVIKAVHVTELRQAINTLRLEHQLPAYSFTDSTLTGQVTFVRAVHFAELREALHEVYDSMGRAVPAITDPTLTQGVTTIKRAHVVELRDAVKAIE